MKIKLKMKSDNDKWFKFKCINKYIIVKLYNKSIYLFLKQFVNKSINKLTLILRYKIW